MHLDHVDQLSANIERLDGEVDRLMAPFAEAATRLPSIPGVAKPSAEVIVAEIGVDMSRFPTAAHLASWAGLCPGNHSRPANDPREGPARVTGCCGRPCARRPGRHRTPATPTWPPSTRRFKRRFGTRSEGKAIFAVAHTMIVVVWHVLSEDHTHSDLGANYYERRIDAEARTRYLVRELERLGQHVILQPAA